MSTTTDTDNALALWPWTDGSLTAGTQYKNIGTMTAWAITKDTINNTNGLTEYFKFLPLDVRTAADKALHPDDPNRVLSSYVTLPKPASPDRREHMTAAQATMYTQDVSAYKEDLRAYEIQHKLHCDVKLRLSKALPPAKLLSLIASLPEALRPFGAAGATIEQLVTAAKKAMHPTEDSRNAARSQLSQAHVTGDNPEGNVNLIRAAITELNQDTSTAVNLADQISGLSTTFGADPVLHTTMQQYYEVTPREDWTFEAIVKKLQVAFDASRITGSLSRATYGYGNAAHGICAQGSASAAPFTQAQLTALMAMLGAAQGAGTAHGAAAPAPAPIPHSNANAHLAGTARPYCHTHGHCGHSSIDCKNKGRNHKNAATAAKKIGGATNGNPFYN
jgi:hypothetical protein